MEKKEKKKKDQLPIRINILFIVVFLMFSLLIYNLGVVQIIEGEAMQEEIDRTIQDISKSPVPRGRILDSNYNEVAANEALFAITYTPSKGIQAKDRLKVAENLAPHITMDTKGVREQSKKEYVYLKNEASLKKDLQKKHNTAGMENDKVYELMLGMITEEDIESISEEELEVIAVKEELDKATTLTPQIIKNDGITLEEYSAVAERLNDLPGINATIDWDRVYPYEGTFRNLIGSLTTQAQGIPAEKADYYLTRGYSRNDRVGSSGLEGQYEDLLRGRKEQVSYTTSKNGAVIDSEIIVPGEAGKDIVLTIDMDFQQEVDKILREEMKAIINQHPYQHRFLTEAVAVVMNPKTGELLAVSGQTHDKENNEYRDTSLKAIHNSYLPGSAIKGATVLAGYHSGVITPGQSFNDRPIQISGSPKKASWMNLGPVNDIDALKRSSNVYIFYIALRMGGVNKYPFPDGDTAPIDLGAWQEMRNYFKQFGLGAPTGVDFPNESTGLEGSGTLPGLLMDNAIGQYDTYTALQLAQYVSTIANDGLRVQPHFVKEIWNPANPENEAGTLFRSTNTTVLNRIQMEQSQIERVQEGFRQVFQASGGTAVRYFGDVARYRQYNAAGKTGTAENAVYENRQLVAETENLSLVGYAPYDDPEIAFSIIVPHTGIVSNKYPVNHRIGQRILDAYFSDDNSNDVEEDEEEQ